MRCVVDCRQDIRMQNDYLQLNLWGKPCFAHVIDAVIDADCFTDYEIQYDSMEIFDYCKKHYPELKLCSNTVEKSTDGIVFCISGRAPCILPLTIRNAVNSFNGVRMISSKGMPILDFTGDSISFYGGSEQQAFNAFSILGGGLIDDRNYAFYHVPDKEAVVINHANDFELALILKKKQENRRFVVRMIDNIIEEKSSVLANKAEGKSICMVGHSQLDQWADTEIEGYKVRNCGISGISSFEYDEKILSKNKLNCGADVFLVMHGTNDIVWDYTIDEIILSIKKTIDYIKERNSSVPIIFLSCLHVNGRIDRNNLKIDAMNAALKKILEDSVIWIDTTFMDDKYGNLDEAYTKDGLHITDTGYKVLKNEIEKTMRGIGL